MNFEMLRLLRLRAPALVARAVRQSAARVVNAISSVGRDYEADIEAMRAMSEYWKRSAEFAANALIAVQSERERLVAEIADLRAARAEFEEGHQVVVCRLAELTTHADQALEMLRSAGSAYDLRRKNQFLSNALHALEQALAVKADG